MKRCIILAAMGAPDVRALVNIRPEDEVICADGGYAFAAAQGITPSLVVGDFDSFHGSIPPEIPVLRVAVEKNDTDTMLCVKKALEHGAEEIILVGCTGGRLDHTIANLQTLAYGCERGCFMLLADQRNLVSMVIGQATVQVPAVEGYKLSLLSYSDECTGVCVSGVKYPLQNATLTATFPLGVSNEFLQETATITCGSGKLLVLLCKD